MYTFAPILNREYEGFIVLELNYSFLGSLCDSFSRSLLSPSFLSDMVSEFETPNYSNNMRLLDKDTMIRDIL
jgi:hypothetical protein